MAIRKIRYSKDPILRKKAKEINNVTDRIKVLLDDMAETMYSKEGLGLAAPQVGVLRRAVVVDAGQGLYKLIDPRIVEQEGELIDFEGCLSIPRITGKVKRPEKVKVEYTDIDGNRKEVEGEGLFARALCHEIDHLDGILFTDLIIEEDKEKKEK
ncbi:peptide deformylase [Acidilutibacter cellobiosedens]|jgi:peptide deformylase|uniref:Peptide deformylase n=1 Tax=Acidilutibacter cellobiosedens TaxID=2507161 RepID=A0A410QC52_9FIRM|nr:peptide deformylase [Acidilutibacter cellobiosedens]MBE6082433.1 peptide deformylase [Tissierellaceae bacterium]QAT61550.1 peptide deformylase [Acidilutibacter cellobiosedens]